MSSEPAPAPAPAPVPLSVAALVALQCQQMSKILANSQSDKLELSAKNVTALVNALTSAGNILAAADRFEPWGPPPTGWRRTTSFDSAHRMIVTFEQDQPTPADLPPMPEGYGHPEPK